MPKSGGGGGGGWSIFFFLSVPLHYLISLSSAPRVVVGRKGVKILFMTPVQPSGSVATGLKYS